MNYMQNKHGVHMATCCLPMYFDLSHAVYIFVRSICLERMPKLNHDNLILCHNIKYLYLVFAHSVSDI